MKQCRSGTTQLYHLLGQVRDGFRQFLWGCLHLRRCLQDMNGGLLSSYPDHKMSRAFLCISEEQRSSLLAHRAKHFHPGRLFVHLQHQLQQGKLRCREPLLQGLYNFACRPGSISGLGGCDHTADVIIGYAAHSIPWQRMPNSWGAGGILTCEHTCMSIPTWFTPTPTPAYTHLHIHSCTWESPPSKMP